MDHREAPFQQRFTLDDLARSAVFDEQRPDFGRQFLRPQIVRRNVDQVAGDLNALEDRIDPRKVDGRRDDKAGACGAVLAVFLKPVGGQGKAEHREFRIGKTVGKRIVPGGQRGDQPAEGERLGGAVPPGCKQQRGACLVDRWHQETASRRRLETVAFRPIRGRLSKACEDRFQIVLPDGNDRCRLLGFIFADQGFTHGGLPECWMSRFTGTHPGRAWQYPGRGMPTRQTGLTIH